MELRQIKSFLSLTETLHFGRTADLIHLSQPALSLQIQALEEEIGFKLLERNRRETKVTAAGMAFREHAITAVTHLDQAVRHARLAANGKAGLLRIGFISTAGNGFVPDLIHHFGELNPEVGFSLSNVLTLNQIQMLDAGTLDIGYLRLPIGEHPELEVVPVHQESFVLVVPTSHRLACKRRVELGELADENFVFYERAFAPGFHDLILEMMQSAGVVPKVRQTAGQMPTLISLIATGMGISILPESTVRHSGAAVIACEIADVISMSEIGLAVRRRNRPSLVDNFRSFALKQLGHLADARRPTVS